MSKEFRQAAFDFGFDEPAIPVPAPAAIDNNLNEVSFTNESVVAETEMETIGLRSVETDSAPSTVPENNAPASTNFTPPPATAVVIMPPPPPTVMPSANVHVTMPKSTRGRKPKAVSNLPKQPGKRGRKSFKEMKAEADLINIPDDEILFQKQYYSIGEVAEMFRVNYSLLRLWANEFDGFLQPRKNRKGDRFFRPVDVKNLHLIYHLLREKKYTMEGAKDYIKNQKKKADQQFEITVALNKLKAFLLELKANL